MWKHGKINIINLTAQPCQRALQLCFGINEQTSIPSIIRDVQVKDFTCNLWVFPFGISFFLQNTPTTAS
jgi:hypothetical protein